MNYFVVCGREIFSFTREKKISFVWEVFPFVRQKFSFVREKFSFSCLFEKKSHSDGKYSRSYENKSRSYEKFSRLCGCLWNRAGVYETLCPKHMLVPKDNLKTRLLYYYNCQSWERIIQPNIYRFLLKVNQVIYILDIICMPNIKIKSPRGSPDILLTRSLMG